MTLKTTKKMNEKTENKNVNKTGELPMTMLVYNNTSLFIPRIFNYVSPFLYIYHWQTKKQTKHRKDGN
jgi:hypothetical protein